MLSACSRLGRRACQFFDLAFRVGGGRGAGGNLGPLLGTRPLVPPGSPCPRGAVEKDRQNAGQTD
eukprot:15460927-Alexandrium_andersonii.AAC.1